MSKLEEMIGLGVELWNDSCDLRELSEAVARGAVGATSNPVIVATVIESGHETWSEHLRRIARDHPGLSDEALASRWIDAIAVEASRVLLPVFERTGGDEGFLNVQVSPRKARDARAMIAEARHLASLAPNIAVKIPLTRAGLAAIEALSAEGIRTNATVSFTVSGAIAAAEAMERGGAFGSYVTIMVGRVADYLESLQNAELRLAQPGTAAWGGVAVFKEAHRLFREKGLGPTLVAAAYRHVRQWTELIGDGVIQSIPYRWWRAFDASDAALASTIDRPVPGAILEDLERWFPELVRARDEHGMRPEDLEAYGASVATLRQFEAGFDAVVARAATLREGS